MLVGREPELRVIDALLAGARVADSQVLVLSGEPGIGKTALLAEAQGLVADMQVLGAQGVESEQYVAFAGLLQLLRPLLGLLDQIPAPQARALSSALLLTAVDEAEPSRFAVGAATLSLLCRAAEDRPLAVFVDDGHLLDQASAEALIFAARRLVSDPVAVLVAVREAEPGAAIWSTLPTRSVAGLDETSARVLVAGAVGSLRAQQQQRLFAETAGNPLALLELADRVESLSASPADTPLALSERLRQAFLARVEGLGPGAQAVLLVAAADSSSRVTIASACRLLGVDSSRLAEAVDAGLVVMRGEQVDFRHPLVRAAVYGAADPATRREVHRALATATSADDVDRLAWHLSESAVAPDEETALTLDSVARAASARGAHTIAASAQERAAHLTGDTTKLAPRLAAAGEAACLAGLTVRADKLFGQALSAGPPPLLRVHIHELQGALDTRCGSLEAAKTLLMDAAGSAPTDHPEAAIRLYADAIHACFYLGAPAEAMRASAAIERLLPSTTDPSVKALGTMASGMAMVLGGSGAPGIEKVRAATYELAVPTPYVSDRFRLPLHVQGALWLRDLSADRRVVGDAIDAMRERASLGLLPYLLMHIARDAATTDRWDDAEAAYLEAIQLAEETSQSTDLAVSMAGLAILQARRGQARECQANVLLAAPVCRLNHIRLGTFWLEFAQGDLAAGAGDLPGAVVHYEALEALLSSVGFTDPDQSCAPELVEAHVHLGRLAEALRVAQEFSLKASAKGQSWSLARACRAIALCSGPEAESQFRTALEHHGQTPDGYELARTELSFGSFLRRERRRVEARPLLRSALAKFESLGAVPWADKAAQELLATGETANRREADPLDSLTPQERQVAQLLAAGRTTREAAAALFISPKTVEYHLRHVYQKLDLRSRDALASALALRN